MNAPTTAEPQESETVLIDPEGDLLEIAATDGGIYVTVEQGGIIATVGPFPASAVHAR